ncbi:MAG TPA: zinc ribbon domain-containing protein [Gammaproteobacteria bacterium]|jgi:hypothetical protein|nr:zinc ribbon domain-containing protein [Gammaproteobacteria bacterium]
MASITCRHCGREVNAPAEACPNCGAHLSGGIPWGAVLVVVVLLSAGYWVFQDFSGVWFGAPPAGRSSPVTGTSQDASGADSAWRNTTSRDATTGALQVFAASPMVTPAEAGAPFGGTQAWVGVGCDGEGEWGYIGFTKAPRLNPVERGAGYEVVKAKVWWNDSVEDTAFRRNTGSDTFLFMDRSAAIAKIAASHSIRLELDAPGQHPAYFTFSLNGSFAAIARMREQCARRAPASASPAAPAPEVVPEPESESAPEAAPGPESAPEPAAAPGTEPAPEPESAPEPEATHEPTDEAAASRSGGAAADGFHSFVRKANPRPAG